MTIEKRVLCAEIKSAPKDPVYNTSDRRDREITLMQLEDLIDSDEFYQTPIKSSISGRYLAAFSARQNSRYCVTSVAVQVLNNFNG